MLDLPREYKPIWLARIRTISSKRKQNQHVGNGSIDIPTLPEFSNEIDVGNGVDSLSANDEELTLSCAEGIEPKEINKEQNKIQSDISKLMDLFKLPWYQKKVLPPMAKKNKFNQFFPRQLGQI